MRIAIYGGSFDPPHISHVLAVSYAFSIGAFDRVIVVPVFKHAFNKQLTPFRRRLEMCELAFSMLPVDVSKIESRLEQPSYTIHTVEKIISENSGHTWSLMVGSDVLHEKEKWYQFDRLIKLAPLFVIGRSGFPHPDAPPAILPEVSSTRVRSLLRNKMVEEAKRLVPANVLDYIEEREIEY